MRWTGEKKVQIVEEIYLPGMMRCIDRAGRSRRLFCSLYEARMSVGHELFAL
jgi:hypothetical protein